MPVMSIAKFERFFRAAAGLDVDKNDLKRYSGFVNDKVYDLLLIGQATAKANNRDILEPWDLPVTKGLQESMHRFRGPGRRDRAATDTGRPHRQEGRPGEETCRSQPRVPSGS